ncbi:MAG TPA: hypothetical protein V6C46_03040 [Coleofasciculaceae cyanobacterium]
MWSKSTNIAPVPVRITYGYSRVRRPDLKQLEVRNVLSRNKGQRLPKISSIRTKAVFCLWNC